MAHHSTVAQSGANHSGFMTRTALLAATAVLSLVLGRAQAEDAVGEVAGGTVGEHIDQIGGFGASRMRGGLPRASSPVVVVA